jgi:hypothetical protein
MMNQNYAIKSNLLKLSIISLFFYMTNLALAARSDSLFLSDEIINLEVRTDFSAIQADRIDNPEYHNGELIYKNPDGKIFRFSVKIMARGNFRRSPVNCNFPPLFVNFKKNEVQNTLFDNQDRLKLVTPCQNEEYVVEEYMIYKMYNEVTDLSLKTRLAKILYFDTGTGKKVFEKYSFFIEDVDHFSERINAMEVDRMMMSADLNRENVNRMAVFQYIIGNREWFINIRHNIMIMQPADTSIRPFAVPYDFDFSAFVNAAYTKPKGIPDSLLGNRRAFKGLCLETDEAKEIFDFYRGQRQVFESIIKKKGLIPQYSRNRILAYIDRFYIITESSELIKQEFMDVCEDKNQPPY